MGAIGTGLVWTGGAAALGAGVGVATEPKTPLPGALNVSMGALGITMLGGIVVALVSEKNRQAALATAGLSLAGILIEGLVYREAVA